MKPEFILLICAGGVFLSLLLIYSLVALERSKSEKKNREKLHKSYSDENLRKMEYDVAYYDKNSFRFTTSRETERQVTIDDLLVENSDGAIKTSDAAVFTQIEDEGAEEIVGTYKPEN
ncbi:MAG: hypothetical protein K2O44_06635 [Clostridia bacterium]|nr:hypothetical protein [Clostridia bacterium]